MNAIYTLAIAALPVAVGDLTLAHWARTSQFPFLLIGLILNIAGILIYSRSLHTGNIAIATAVFLGLNIFAVSLGSIILFREELSLARGIGLFGLLLSMIFVEIMR